MDIGCEYCSEINLFSVDSWNAWINEVLDDCQTVFASWPFFSYYTDDLILHEVFGICNKFVIVLAYKDRK